MPELGRFARELRLRLWKPSVQDEVHAEVRQHLEMMVEDLVARGVAPDEARRQALARFGDVERIEAECLAQGRRRDEVRRRMEWLGELRQDVRQAVRQLRASPRFTSVALVTLAVGLGASTTIFGVANAVLLRALPFPAADRLVLFLERTPTGQRFAISEPNYLDWSARARTLQSAAIFQEAPMALVEGGEPEQLRGARATHTLFATLGVAPSLGRAFRAEEDRRGGDWRVAVISHALWQRRFGGNRDVLNQVVNLDGAPQRIVGVMPPGFEFPSRTDVWTPLVASPEYPRADRRNEGVARLKDGVTLAQASDELRALAARTSQEHPASNEGWSTEVLAFREWFVSPQLETRVLVLLATVALLLVMACVNVASLLLARAAAREREMAVRAALGAGRWRIVRQLLTESLVLSGVGATAGVLLAVAAVPVIRRVGAVAIPRLTDLAVDWRVLAFAIPACVVTGLVFGAAPAWRLTRAGSRGDALHDVLRSGTRVADSGRVRNGLIVMSVALAMVLLVGAGLVGSSFRKLMGTDLGFSGERVLIAHVSLPEEGLSSEKLLAYFTEATRQIEALPGIEAVGAINIAPFSGGNTAMGYAPLEERTDRDDGPRASWRAVTPGYFQAMQVPLKRGRLFTTDDVIGAPQAIIVSEQLAARAWPGEDPLGRQLALKNGRVMSVVGVVGDTRLVDLDSLPAPTMYFAHGQFPWPNMWFTIRTAGDPLLQADAVRRALAAINPLLPVANVRAQLSLVRERSAEPRLTMLVFGIFAGSALVLAAVGLYGTVAYTVAQRTREIGVTLALGAQPARVVRGVLGNGLRLAVVGVVVGGGVALALTGSLRAILYDTEPSDPLTYAAVALLLLAVAGVASAGPARRAARLDPVQALRGE